MKKDMTDGFDGSRFQKALHDMIRALRPTIMVETGVSTGGSTAFILKAMDANGFGTLHSVDPNADYPIKHPRWRLHRKLSTAALGEIYKETGPWDIFLHDSNHGVGCMTFEFEVAYDFVRPSGVVMADDYTWDNHNAWANFLLRKGYPAATNLGSCQFIHKNPSAGCPDSTEETINRAFKLADDACVKFGKKPYSEFNETSEGYLLNLG